MAASKTKTVRVSEKTHRALFARKGPDDTYDDLIEQMMEQTDGPTPSDMDDNNAIGN